MMFARECARPRLIALVVVLFVSGMATSGALAQDKKGHPTAVFNVIAEGASDELAGQITAVLKREAAANLEYQLVQQEDIALLESLLLVGCEEPTPACMSTLGATLSADRLIYARLVARGELYDIEVNVFDVPSKVIKKRWNKRFTANADAVGFFVKEMEVFIGGKVPVTPARLRVSANVDNAAVLIDGKRAGRTPYVNESLNPGKHTVVVEKEGHEPWSREIHAQSSAEMSLVAELIPKAGAAVGEGNQVIIRENGGDDGNPPTFSADETLRLSTVGWISVGLGTAAIINGTVFGILTSQTQSDFDNTPYEQEAVDLADTGETQALVANISFAAGAAALVTGVILIIADDHKTPKGSTTGATFGIAPTNDGAALQFELTY